MLQMSPQPRVHHLDSSLRVSHQQIFRQDWFSSYSAAVFEDDAHQLEQRIGTARRAIAERFSKLDAGETPLHLETRDLKKALATLDLLEGHPLAKL